MNTDYWICPHCGNCNDFGSKVCERCDLSSPFIGRDNRIEQLEAALKVIAGITRELFSKKPLSLALPYKDKAQQFVNDSEHPLQDIQKIVKELINA